METLKDILAYVVHVGSKPLPYIFAALIAAWTIGSFEVFDDGNIALGAAVLLAVAASLIFLPPLLWVKEKADDRIASKPDRCERWLPAQAVGIAMFILFVLVLDRYS